MPTRLWAIGCKVILMINRLFEFFFATKSLFFGRYIRDDNLVIINSCFNNYVGNCRYAAMAIQKEFPKKKIVWIVKNYKQFTNITQNSSIYIVPKNTLKSMQMISKAKYILSDGGFCGHYMAHGAVQIDFWHGYPIKKIRYDANNFEPNIIRTLLWKLNSNNFIQSGGSNFTTTILCETYRLPEKMGHSLGQPCIAPLVDEKILKKEINEIPLLKNLYKEKKKYKKVFLYAPTYRDNGSNFLDSLNFDIQKLNNACVHSNTLFLIKMHPSCHLSFSKDFSHIKILNNHYDGAMTIALSDVVVTDYSSIYHYAMAGGKKIIMMHGDLEQYRIDNRDLYDWALDDFNENKINNFNDLCKIIEEETPLQKTSNSVINKYWDKGNLNNPYRFLKYLQP